MAVKTSSDFEKEALDAKIITRFEKEALDAKIITRFEKEALNAKIIIRAVKIEGLVEKLSVQSRVTALKKDA